MNKFFLLILLFCSGISCSNQKEQIVSMSTTMGDIKVKLYNETPKHRDNFLKLVKEQFYDSVLFHRVIQNFMIQAGDPESKTAASGTLLGEGDNGYTIDAEFQPRYFHKRGVLAAAREGDEVNPQRKSSGSHFYMVLGVVYSPEKLDNTVKRINERRKIALYNRIKSGYEAEYARLQKAEDQEGMDRLTEEIAHACDSLFVQEELVLTPEQKKIYTTVGGTPHLDGQYTVFGEIVEGMEVMDKIAAVQTDANDRPLENVVILHMEIIK